MGEPDLEKWLKDKLEGRIIQKVTVDEDGRIDFVLSDFNTIEFYVEGREIRDGFQFDIIAYEV